MIWRVRTMARRLFATIAVFALLLSASESKAESCNRDILVNFLKAGKVIGTMAIDIAQNRVCRLDGKGTWPARYKKTDGGFEFDMRARNGTFRRQMRSDDSGEISDHWWSGGVQFKAVVVKK